MNLHHQGSPLSWRQLADGLQHTPAVRAGLTEALRSSPHPAFFFETNPVSRGTADRLVEVVLTDSPALAAITPDPGPFRRKFTPGQPIASFRSLGKDAQLISPSPALTPHRAGPHLAAFLRHAPPHLIEALWQTLGHAVEAHWRASDKPVWVSTSGLGVHWLHLRLDQRPKYYVHQPFTRFIP